MLIDCTTCVARDLACGDCVVTVLLSRPAPPVTRAPRAAARTAEPADDAFELDDAAREAITHLAGAGLVPPLRLVSGMTAPPGPGRDIA